MQELSEEERFILLLYGLGFNDGEIADLLKIVRRTVNYKRQRGFEKVRKRMEARLWQMELMNDCFRHGTGGKTA